MLNEGGLPGRDQRESTAELVVAVSGDGNGLVFWNRGVSEDSSQDKFNTPLRALVARAFSLFYQPRRTHAGRLGGFQFVVDVVVSVS